MSKSPWMEDRPLSFPSCAAFIKAIEPLPAEDQARLVALMLLERDWYPQNINDPAMQAWIVKHAVLVRDMAGFRGASND